MKIPHKMEFILAAVLMASLLISVYGPIYYFGSKLNENVGNTELELIRQFGQPDLEITIKQINSKPQNWRWWGAPVTNQNQL